MARQKHAHFHVYRSKRGWSWRLKINGVIIATAGESYTRRRAAVRATTRVTAYVKSDRLFTVVDEPRKPRR
jgi:uncharacterized protein YegP (UPF0339 family)